MSYQANKNRYGDMPYRRVGKSGLKLPVVSLGLWHNFGTNSDPDVRRDILLTAFDRGVTHFDLANNYGPIPGSAETNFGEVLARDLRPYRDEMIISTKAGYLMWDGPYGEWGSRKYLLASLDQSLRRMGLDYVDIFYSHRPDPETPLEETAGALDSAVRQGKALYVGISSYSPEDTRRMAEIFRRLGTPFVIHQPVYNMFNRWIEDGLTDALADNGLGAISFSPLAQGLLTGRYLDGIPADSRVRKSNYLPESEVERRLPAVRALNEIAAARGQTLAQMAIAWDLRQPTMSSVIIGASRVSQLEDNLGAIRNLDFSAAELAAIDSILSESK